MAYADIAQVSAMCRNLLGDSEYFDTSSSPTAVDVEFWLSSGCSILETYIANWGYYTPVANNLPLYDWLRELNALYAASRAELTRINVTLSPGERTRGQVFDDMFWKQLKELGTMNLSALGATHTTVGGATAKLFVGGLTETSKEDMRGDSNTVQPRFKRDMLTMGTGSDDYDTV